MAFTPTEEALLRQLLAKNPELLTLADNQTKIISELGAEDITIPELPAATSIGGSDSFILRQGADDKSLSANFLASSESLTTHINDKDDPHQTLPKGGQPGQVLLVQPDGLSGWSNNLTTLEQQAATLEADKVDKSEWQELVPGKAYKRPDGIIIQMGVAPEVPGGRKLPITFPVAFPAACLSLQITLEDNTPGEGGISFAPAYTNITLTGFSLSCEAGYSGLWLAIGK